MTTNQLVQKFLVWRIKHVSSKNFVMLLAAIIGAIVACIAIALKWLTHNMHHLLTHDFKDGLSNYYFLFFPIVGLIITMILAKYVFKVKMGHGVSTILYAISQSSSLMKKRKMVSAWFTAIFTVGFGGSAGLESPILTTGAAIGANVGHTAHMSYRKRTLLIGCGAAGAISAIFNAPVAGIIFTIEIILADTAVNTLIPLIIASVSGKLVTMAFSGSHFVFEWKQYVQPYTVADVPYFILLGALAGMVALYFTVVQYFFENLLNKFKNDFVKVISAGVVLSLIIFAFPPIYGEGYHVLNKLVSGDAQSLLEFSWFSGSDSVNFLLGFLALVFVFKAIATAITIESGGSGGIFAPSLFIGAIFGFLFATVVNRTGVATLSVPNFTLLGMCAVMSGIQHAPLSAIFLIAELTGGYALFIPLMIVSVLSNLSKTYFEPYSIYTKKLILKGQLISNRDKQVLSLIEVKKLVEKDFLPVNVNSTLGQLTEVIQESKRSVFPVVDIDHKLVGIIRLDDVRRIMFDQAAYDKIMVKAIMSTPRATVKCSEDMNQVMAKFEATNTWNLAVVCDEGKYLGMVSKSAVFNSYRNRLKRQQKED